MDSGNLLVKIEMDSANPTTNSCPDFHIIVLRVHSMQSFVDRYNLSFLETSW